MLFSLINKNMSMLLIEEPGCAWLSAYTCIYMYVHILCSTPLGSMNLGTNVLARRTAVPLAQLRFTKIYIQKRFIRETSQNAITVCLFFKRFACFNFCSHLREQSKINSKFLSYLLYNLFYFELLSDSK